MLQALVSQRLTRKTLNRRCRRHFTPSLKRLLSPPLKRTICLCTMGQFQYMRKQRTTQERLKIHMTAPQTEPRETSTKNGSVLKRPAPQVPFQTSAPELGLRTIRLRT